MSLDLDKPVQTRDRRKVNVLTTTAKGEFPVIGEIEDTTYLALWYGCGRYYRYVEEEDPRDLVNVPVWTLSRHLPGFRALRKGEEWMTSSDGPWQKTDLPSGYRPLLEGEKIDETDQYWEGAQDFAHYLGVPVNREANSKTLTKHRTTRPLPPIKKRVPLGPDDFVPGTAMRREDRNWHLVLRTPSFTDCAAYEKEKWQIKRPGEDWQTASKETTEE